MSRPVKGKQRDPVTKEASKQYPMWKTDKQTKPQILQSIKILTGVVKW